MTSTIAARSTTITSSRSGTSMSATVSLEAAQGRGVDQDVNGSTSTTVSSITAAIVSSATTATSTHANVSAMLLASPGSAAAGVTHYWPLLLVSLVLLPALAFACAVFRRRKLCLRQDDPARQADSLSPHAVNPAGVAADTSKLAEPESSEDRSEDPAREARELELFAVALQFAGDQKLEGLKAEGLEHAPPLDGGKDAPVLECWLWDRLICAPRVPGLEVKAQAIPQPRTGAGRMPQEVRGPGVEEKVQPQISERTESKSTAEQSRIAPRSSERTESTTEQSQEDEEKAAEKKKEEESEASHYIQSEGPRGSPTGEME